MASFIIKSIKRVTQTAMLAGVLLAAGPDRLPAQSPADATGFPMEVGNRWTYAGTVWWLSWDGQTTLMEWVRWPMEVVDLVERGRHRAAVLEGHPLDLLTDGEGRKPGRYLLVEVAGSTYYLLAGDRVDAALERLADPADRLDDLVGPEDLVLALPLFRGKRFCSADTAERDGLRCWTVTEAAETDLEGVLGVDLAEPGTRYLFQHRAVGDHAIWGFVPGVGLTSFALGQSGRVSAVELKLVEASIGGDDHEPGASSVATTASSRAPGGGQPGD